MSYSFNVHAPTKAAAKDAVSAKFDEVVATQPIHARDRNAVLANANAVIDLLMEDDTRDIAVSVSGYVGWQEVLREDSDNPLQSASVSASAYYVAK
jgi:hypothetical protein